MKTEWIDLPTMADVARAQVEGWEIEHAPGFDSSLWSPWSELSWHVDRPFRGRPRQSKTRSVTMFCWFDGTSLIWRAKDKLPGLRFWIRIPAEDKEIEVPE